MGDGFCRFLRGLFVLSVHLSEDLQKVFVCQVFMDEAPILQNEGLYQKLHVALNMKVRACIVVTAKVALPLDSVKL